MSTTRITDASSIEHQACLDACRAISRAYRDERLTFRREAKRTQLGSTDARSEALQQVEDALAMNNPNATTFMLPGKPPNA